MDLWHSQTPEPEILAVQTAAKTAVFEVQSVDLRFSNGQMRTYQRLAPGRRPAVMTIALDGDDLLMVREYAVGTERYELGFSKGLMDEGETPEQSADRELQEEIGFGARKITLLRTLYSSPSHMYGPMHILLAEQLYPARLEGDEPEPLQIVRVPVCQALSELIADPEFGESRNLCALFLLRDLLAQRRQAA